MFWLKEKASLDTPISQSAWVCESWVPRARTSPAGFQNMAVESSATAVKLSPIPAARAPIPIFWKFVLVLPAPLICWAKAENGGNNNRTIIRKELIIDG
jgi:hypothetical protein